MFKNRAWYHNIVYVAPPIFLSGAVISGFASHNIVPVIGFLNTAFISANLVCIVEGTNRLLKAMEDSFIARAKASMELKNIIFDGLKGTRDVNVAEFEQMRDFLLATLTDQEKIDAFTEMFSKKVTTELRELLEGYLKIEGNKDV